MKTAARRSPADRDRAVARLRSLTLGTGIASFAAVGAFGAIAAHSYDGASTSVTTAAVVAADNGTTTAAAAAGKTTTTTTTTSTTTTAAQATAAPTAATGTAHATSGSS